MTIDIQSIALRMVPSPIFMNDISPPAASNVRASITKNVFDDFSAVLKVSLLILYGLNTLVMVRRKSM